MSKKRLKMTKSIILLMDNKTIRVDGIPKHLRLCDVYYNERQLRALIGVSGSKCADDYGHNVMCIHFLIERKSNGNVLKAIKQLEDTALKLQQMSKPIKEVIIISDGLDKDGSRIYFRMGLTKMGQEFIKDAEIEEQKNTTFTIPN